MRQLYIVFGCIVLLSLMSCFTYDPRLDSPDRFSSEHDGANATSHLLSDRVLSLAVDSRYVWVGTDRGLSRYDKVGHRWDNFTVKDGLVHNTILSIASDGDQIWIGTRDSANRYDMQTNAWTHYLPRDGLAGREVSSIAVDSRYVWFGTPNGLSRYDKETDTWAQKRQKDGLAGDNVTRIIAEEGYIWIGTQDGVSRYDKRTDSWNNYNKDNGLIDNNVTAIAADEDSLWFGTEGKGVSLYDKRNSEFVKAFTKRDKLASDQIKALVVDGTSLWQGTADSSVQRYILSVNTWRYYTAKEGLPSNHITAVAADGNVVWFGTYEHGLARYDMRGERWTTYGEIHALSDNDVKGILATDEAVWVGTRSGLNRYSTHGDPDVAADFLRESLRGDWRTFTKAEGLADNYITCVTEVDGHLWVGTPHGLGVRRSHAEHESEGAWTFYTTKDGLADDFVTCMAWEQGNQRIDESANRRRVLPIENSSLSRSTDRRLGLSAKVRGDEKSEEVESTPSRFTSHVSRLWIGTKAGLSTYDLQTHQWNTHPPELAISGRINDIELEGDFVWVATSDGLVYYDSSSGLSARLAEKDGLPTNVINAVAVGNDSIWAGTRSGLVRLDKLTNQRIDGLTFHVSSITFHAPTLGQLSPTAIQSGLVHQTGWQNTTSRQTHGRRIHVRIPMENLRTMTSDPFR